MKRFTADLHIHTCLSPCSEVDMTPRRIIERAVSEGLDIIAISDHNSAENTEIAVKMARERGITALPAMEITSSEEAHVLAFFGSVEKAMAMQEMVYSRLSKAPNDEKLYGYQLIVNEADEILEFSKKLLIGATSLPVKELVEAIHSNGGLAVASHIDKEAFSVVSQLGFIPYDIPFDGLEISYNSDRQKAEAMFSEYASIPWITSSDAHHLEDIGKKTTSFFLEEASFEEIVLAFKGERRIAWS